MYFWNFRTDLSTKTAAGNHIQIKKITGIQKNLTLKLFKQSVCIVFEKKPVAYQNALLFVHLKDISKELLDESPGYLGQLGREILKRYHSRCCHESNEPNVRLLEQLIFTYFHIHWNVSYSTTIYIM